MDQRPKLLMNIKPEPEHNEVDTMFNMVRKTLSEESKRNRSHNPTQFNELLKNPITRNLFGTSSNTMGVDLGPRTSADPPKITRKIQSKGPIAKPKPTRKRDLETPSPSGYGPGQRRPRLQ